MFDYDAKVFIYGTKVTICTFTDKAKQLIANTAISAYLCFPIFCEKV